MIECTNTNNWMQGSSKWRLVYEEGFDLPVFLNPVHLLDVDVEVAHPGLLELVEVAPQLLQVIGDIYPNIKIVCLWKEMLSLTLSSLNKFTKSCLWMSLKRLDLHEQYVQTKLTQPPLDRFSNSNLLSIHKKCSMVHCASHRQMYWTFCTCIVAQLFQCFCKLHLGLDLSF